METTTKKKSDAAVSTPVPPPDAAVSTPVPPPPRRRFAHLSPRRVPNPEGVKREIYGTRAPRSHRASDLGLRVYNACKVFWVYTMPASFARTLWLSLSICSCCFFILSLLLPNCCCWEEMNVRGVFSCACTVYKHCIHLMFKLGTGVSKLDFSLKSGPRQSCG